MGRRRRGGGRRAPRRAGGLRHTGPGAAKGRTKIDSVSPTGTIISTSPRVHAVVTDNENSLSKSDIFVSLDGQQIRGFRYQRSTGKLSFTARALSSGTHTVEIEASAGEGSKTARKTWTFAVE
jgi:hypothetical protein